MILVNKTHGNQEREEMKKKESEGMFLPVTK